VIVGATIPFAGFSPSLILVRRGESANLLSVGATIRTDRRCHRDSWWRRSSGAVEQTTALGSESQPYPFDTTTMGMKSHAILSATRRFVAFDLFAAAIIIAAFTAAVHPRATCRRAIAWADGADQYAYQRWRRVWPPFTVSRELSAITAGAYDEPKPDHAQAGSALYAGPELGELRTADIVMAGSRGAGGHDDCVRAAARPRIGQAGRGKFGSEPRCRRDFFPGCRRQCLWQEMRKLIRRTPGSVIMWSTPHGRPDDGTTPTPVNAESSRR